MHRWIALALLVLLWPAAGCRISRHIVDLEPTTGPSLQELERNLDYQDPDQGRADYIFPTE